MQKPTIKKRKNVQENVSEEIVSQPKKFMKNNKGNKKETISTNTPKKTFQKKADKQKFKKDEAKASSTNKTNIANEEELDFNTEDGKNMILITKMNKIATKIFSKNKEDPTKKIKIIETSLNKISALIPKLINKRSASKFFQACFKFGNDSQKSRIFDALKGSDLSEIFKSKYGHFLLIKIIKKGTKEQKQKIYNEILKNAWFFVSHKEAGQVIDTFIKTATNQQIQKLKEIFKVKPNEKTEKIENAAMRIIEKDLINYTLSQFILSETYKTLIPNEKEKVFEKIKENFLDLGKSKEGVSLAIEIINHANNKQKKLLLKSVKGKIVQSIQETDKKFLIILKLMLSVDDREVLNKYLLKEISSNFDDILKTNNGITLISSLLIPKHNILETMEKGNKITTCKKDDNVRREEILSILLPNLMTSLKNDIINYLKNFSLSRVISHIIQYILSNEEFYEKYQDFVENVFSCFENEMNDGLSSTDTKTINENYLITHPDANRVLKSLIRLSNETKIEDAKAYLDNKNEMIYEFLMKNLVLYIKTRLIFLVISLIENTNYKEALIQHVQKIKHKIPESTQGFNILKQII